MNRRRLLLIPILLLGVVKTTRAADSTRLPNVVVIFCDDLGYADVGCYGAAGYKTPHIDRLASEGIRFTDFYVAQAVCSASRAALLTGCYPNRVGILGALGPKANTGIHSNEVTLAEMLKARGYATAIFGKWHLGDRPEFLPTRHGFDEYFGLPYSNDMWPMHPTSTNYPPLPLLEQETIVERNPDQTQLTTLYTERAVAFIEHHQDAPFFLYLPHSMPHVPLHVSDKFKGKTTRGLYGDVIEEIDWSVGQISAALRKHGLEDRTLLIFTSDNGPWRQYGNHAGSAGYLREAKGTSFEGGVRVPFLARWPGKIPPGAVCREAAMTIDLLPTLARLIGAGLPPHPIDGLDISPLLFGAAGAKCPHDALYFYWSHRLEAVRSGPWKLVISHDYPHVVEPGVNGKPGRDVRERIGDVLFNLTNDPGETLDVSGQFPEIVARLTALAQRAREELGDSGTGRKGNAVRQPGRTGPDHPKTRPSPVPQKPGPGK